MKPLMKDHQVTALEQTLLALGRQGKQPIDVLEWGAGSSTAYFTRMLREHGMTYRWLSLEHDRGWYEKVRVDLGGDPNVEVKWLDTGADGTHWRKIPMDEYVNYPAAAGRQFDFIFVDGRKRRRCLLEAKKLLKPDGVVFLHDAHRRYYHCAQDTYVDNRFIDRELWRGSNTTVSAGQRLRNALNRFYYRNIAKTVESLVRAKALKRIFGVNAT